MLSPSQRSLRARIAAYSLHASRDPRETTAKARAAFLATFEAQVDPDGVLPKAERLRRAESARKAYFARLALKRSRSQSKKSAATVDKTVEARAEVRRDSASLSE